MANPEACIVNVDTSMKCFLVAGDQADNERIFGGDVLVFMGLDMPYVCAVQPSHGEYLRDFFHDCCFKEQ
jgi:hypothetical protein